MDQKKDGAHLLLVLLFVLLVVLLLVLLILLLVLLVPVLVIILIGVPIGLNVAVRAVVLVRILILVLDLIRTIVIVGPVSVVTRLLVQVSRPIGSFYGWSIIVTGTRPLSSRGTGIEIVVPVTDWSRLPLLLMHGS